MAEKKKQTKCNCGGNCECCNKSAFPICFLACVMTALLVALGFSVGIAATINYNLKNDLVIQSSGQFFRETDGKDSSKIIRISASGLIDFFAGDQTGFIYASAGDCLNCSNFTARLADIAKEQGVTANTFRYVYPLEPDDFDEYVYDITVANEDGPVLIYVRDGKIYDRLDDPNSELAISSFLAKYK